LTPEKDIAEDARRELQRVLASGILASSPRQARLFQHIVERSLLGEKDSLKEYSIGLDVFGRDASFDPKVDSIVRSTARQLRLKLAEYYESEGQANPVRIRLPKGSYLAVIEESAGSVAAADSGRRIRHWIWACAAAMGFAALAIALLAGRWKPLRANRSRTVAVLSLRDYSPHQDLAYLADGLRDGLTSALVHTKGLEVTARVSSARALEQGQTPGQNFVETARNLRADSVVSGSISPAGSRLQVVVALVDGTSGKYLWSRTYDATAADLPAIEHSAASGIARALGATAEVPAPLLPRSSEALELYLRACSLARTRHPTEIREAAGLFERVILLDPDFAPAYAAAGSNYLVSVWNGPMQWDPEGKRGMELARKAADLDPTLADAHSALAYGWQAQWRWRDADSEISRAIDLDPRYPRAYFQRAFNLAILRRFDEAERAIETARTLDPGWAAPNGLLAELYYYEHRYSDAHALARRLRDTNPDFFDNLEGRIYDLQGRPDLARPFHLKAPTPLDRAAVRVIDGDAQAAYRDLVVQLSTSGNSSYELASFVFLNLHDRAATLKLLEQALRKHDPDVVSLALDPLFDPLRSDARIVAILHELNLSE
jgi:adenylate cyclase